MILILLMALARGLHFVAVCVLCGASAFQLYAPKAARPVSILSRNALQGWALLLALSGVAWAALLVVSVSGDPSSLVNADVLRGFFLETGFGRVWLFRFVIMLLVALAVAMAPDLASAPSGAARRFHIVLYLACAALLVSQAWIGHSYASALAGDWSVLLVYAVHVMAAAIWIGGLWPLVFVLRAPSLRATQRHEALQSFSRVALVSVIMLVASGMANSLYRIGRAAGDISTAYMLLIVVKIGLLGVALLLAFNNRYEEIPRLQKADLESSATAILLRNITREQWICAATLMAAALLGLLSPTTG